MIDEIDKIDFVGIDNITGKCCLTISDHYSWENEYEHLVLLQDKINSYIGFIESGEIYESYQEARGRIIEIQIHFKFPPNSKCVEFLNQVERVLNGIQVNLSW